MHARIERWSPAGDVLCAPARAYSVNFDCLVCAPGVIRARKCHNPAVSEGSYGGIPASMSHVLNVGKGVGRGIKNRRSRLTIKRVVLQRTPIYERTSVG